MTFLSSRDGAASLYYPLLHAFRKTFLAPSSSERDNSDTGWRCYEARYSRVCRNSNRNSRRYDTQDLRRIRHRLNRPRHVYIYVYACVRVCVCMHIRLMCQIFDGPQSGRNKLRAEYGRFVRIPLSCFVGISIAVECARSNFYLLFQIQCAIYFRENLSPQQNCRSVNDSRGINDRI